MANQQQIEEAARLSGTIQQPVINEAAPEPAPVRKAATKKDSAALVAAPPLRTAEKGRKYYVTDTSATLSNPKRIHEIILNNAIKSVSFQYGAPTELNFIEAMKFQKDGFVIKDEDDTIVRHAPETKLEDMKNFGPSAVVANLHELRRDALFARAVIIPGGENFNHATAVDTLIAFLESSAIKKLHANSKARSDIGIDDMNEDELETMGVAAE